MENYREEKFLYKRLVEVIKTMYTDNMQRKHKQWKVKGTCTKGKS